MMNILIVTETLVEGDDRIWSPPPPPARRCREGQEAFAVLWVRAQTPSESDTQG